MAKPVVDEAGRQRRRATRSGVVLSHELIVQTALRMLAEHGAAGLSARRLALALGADPSTVYRYFAGMDDLVLAIGDELISRALRGWASAGAWRADLRALGLRIHREYQAHPQAAVLTANRVSGREHEIAADEVILGMLLAAGFPAETAARVYHVFIDQTLAFAALDAASLALPATAQAADRRMWAATYARLPRRTHPSIAATAPHLVARMNESAYPDALDMVLASAQQLLNEAPEAPADGQ
jgi:AcrR family transcriptional regulator